MPGEAGEGPGGLIGWIRRKLRPAPAGSEDSQPPRSTTPITEADRAAMLQFAREAPPVYGYWRDLKGLYKHVEGLEDPELLGLLSARMDTLAFGVAAGSAAAAGISGLGPIWDIALAGNYAYLTAGETNPSGSLHVFNVSDPVRPVFAGKLQVPFRSRVTVQEHAVVWSPYSYGRQAPFNVVNVSSPGTPKILGSFSFRTGVRDAAVFGSYAYVISGQEYSPATRGYAFKLQVLDISNPAGPRSIGSIEISWAERIAVGPASAVVLPPVTYRNSRHYVHLIDLSNSARPRIVQSLDMPLPAAAVIQGNRAFVACGKDSAIGDEEWTGLQVLDLSGKGRITARLELGNVRDIAVSGQCLYLAASRRGSLEVGNFQPGGFFVIDISNPDEPHVISSITGRDVSMVAVSGGLALIGWGREKVRMVDVSDPTRPVFMGAPPTRHTVGYMKRRARRRLRALADENPDLYVRTAFHLLLHAGKGREAVDPRSQWVSMEILFGSSSRWMQHAHGRGAYAFVNRRFVLKSREELAPHAWDQRLDLVEALFRHPDLPWQTYEVALKILRSSGLDAASLDEPTLLRLISSPSPLLQSTAVREVTTGLEAGASRSPDLVAESVYRSAGRIHSRLMAALDKLGNSGPSGSDFASRLFTLAADGLQSRSATRKVLRSLLLLVRRYPQLMAAQASPELAVQLYVSGQPEMERWALEAIGQTKPASTGAWLAALELAPADRRGPALQRLRDTLQRMSFSRETARALVFADSEFVRREGWNLLAENGVLDAVAAALWNELLESREETPALRTAMSSLAALDLLARFRMSSLKWGDILQSRPFLVSLLPPALFQRVVAAIPIAAVLRLFAAAPDDVWLRLRDAGVSGLRNSDRLVEFWKAAWTAIGEDASGLLQARLLDDPVMAGAFLSVEDPSFVESNDPMFGPLLFRWAAAHSSLFTKDSAHLLSVATHPLPDLRDWGLARVREVGMSLPFALRLLESELPSSAEAGKNFFNGVPAEDERAVEYALALCDSPRRSVRDFGREYTKQQWESLSAADFLQRLSENPDPQIEAFVALKLLEQPEHGMQPQEFDREVLRARDRGRQAKELVKKRLQNEGTTDVPMLLELARSRTVQDADWALQQLARLAVEGQEVEGVVVEGVSGV